MITLSIDVTLLEKSRFKAVTRRSGKVAQFCDLILVPTPGSEYGDYIVKQSVTREERDKGVELPILGNGRNLERGRKTPPLSETTVDSPGQPGTPDDDVPF